MACCLAFLSASSANCAAYLYLCTPSVWDACERNRVEESDLVFISSDAKLFVGAEQRYSALRRVRGDGNCFYRSFLFGYLERLLQGIKSSGDANTKAMLELSRLRQVVHER